MEVLLSLSLFHIACRFNDFFSSIGVSLAETLVDAKVNPLDYIKGYFPLFDFEEVNDIILGF